ncbi:PREDICTED: uncharacterized protein LOC109227709 [Nicotiana attenuata]|uniref:uncharacterized protein LOC109227709 n=1 Tax=Nicotiana attenuata TaxID=49451 RepID=UPI0009051527|nr:PREDICTED: uncharacterized protein LOC109227709 [Nicotiana attenuata]
MTPFEAVYEQKPRLHLPYVAHHSMVDQVDRSLQARESTIRLLKHHLQQAQCRMKAQAEKKRSPRNFETEDLVFVKIKPYKQMSLKGHSYHKLNTKYFGLFKVLQKVGTIAYQLELPPQAKIHHTFHVSQLKKYIGNVAIFPNLPVSLSTHGHIVLEPEAILNRRSVQSRGK